MGKTIRILTNNYSGYAGSIIYYPYTGGTINLGSHLLPYDYNTDYYYGTYEIYISEFNKTCILNYSPPVCDFTGVEQVTPTPTITLTPTSTPTQTLTPTSTPTQTLTPTPTCYCTYIDVTITQIDLDSAVGNTIYPIDNGSVYVKYRKCGGGSASKRYTIAGTYLNDICTNSVSSPAISYYAYNTQENGSSTVVKNGQCCVPTTPTPTPTTTPTMTPAECSIILNDVIFISGTTWGYDFTNTVFSCEQLHLSYSLDNINWNAISTYDCITVPALYDIGVVADIIYFRMTQECGDIPVTSNTIIKSTITPTPTPTNTLTPTKTATNTPTQTNTPTKTPTNTVTPTPTPTNTIPPSFVSVWRTTSSSESVELPYEIAGTYIGTIDWGDGSISANTYANRTHTYATSGDYTVTITGTLIGWSFAVNSNSNSKIIEVLQWGCLRLGNSGGYFLNCGNLSLSGVTDILTLTGTFDLSFMFNQCYNLTTINNLNSWNTTFITNMEEMFSEVSSFNQNIGNWDVSNCTNMVSMFSNTVFNNGGSPSISGWTTSGVTNMSGMFGNTLFDQNIGNWDVSNVQQMGYMFYGTPFNNAGSSSISGWTTSGVTNMSSVFANTSAFNQPIGSWDTSSCIQMISIFANTTSFNQDIGNWDTSNLISMQSMFNSATGFNNGGSPSISGWTTSGVTNMQSVFNSASSFNQPIGNWNTSSCIDMYSMFQNAINFNQNLNGWCVSLIPSQPIGFDTGATSWTLLKPVWGTCPP